MSRGTTAGFQLEKAENVEAGHGEAAGVPRAILDPVSINENAHLRTAVQVKIKTDMSAAELRFNWQCVAVCMRVRKPPELWHTERAEGSVHCGILMEQKSRLSGIRFTVPGPGDVGHCENGSEAVAAQREFPVGHFGV